MADDESTTAEVDSESDDTDVDLEDIEVSAEELESMETKDDEQSESDESEDDTEAEEATDDDESEEAEPTEEEKQAEFKRQMFEKRQQEKAIREQTQKEHQQTYLNESEDAHDLALRQLQIDAYDNKVSRNETTLKNQYETAIKDFDILSSTDPVIQNRVNKALDAFQAQNVSIDAYGNPTEIRNDLYAFLQSEADDIANLTGMRAKSQETSKTKQKSKTMSAPSRSPKEAKVDPDLAAFDEEAYS